MLLSINNTIDSSAPLFHAIIPSPAKYRTNLMTTGAENDNNGESSISNNLKDLREARRLTQKEVGKMLDLSVSAVCRHEVNSRGLTLARVEAYASLYKVSAAEIFVTLPTNDNDTPHT